MSVCLYVCLSVCMWWDDIKNVTVSHIKNTGCIAIRFHLQTLIESGVPLEDRDDFGDMPIHYAAKSGGFSIITTLVEMGVQPGVAGMHCMVENELFLPC